MKMIKNLGKTIFILSFLFFLNSGFHGHLAFAKAEEYKPTETSKNSDLERTESIPESDASKVTDLATMKSHCDGGCSQCCASYESQMAGSRGVSDASTPEGTKGPTSATSAVLGDKN